MAHPISWGDCRPMADPTPAPRQGHLNDRHDNRGERITMGTADREDPLASMPPPNLIETFWSQVDRSGQCWIWRGRMCPNGYGRFHLGNTRAPSVVAHRFAYRIVVGVIPSGLVIDHVAKRGCTSRACVNPAHLEAVTQLENVRRITKKVGRPAQSQCKNGHPFTEANTYYHGGKRRCRECTVAYRKGRDWK